MRNPPMFVEIYSSREGVWAWSVTFDDLSMNRTGTACDFAAAYSAVTNVIVSAQLETTFA